MLCWPPAWFSSACRRRPSLPVPRALAPVRPEGRLGVEHWWPEPNLGERQRSWGLPAARWLARWRTTVVRSHPLRRPGCRRPARAISTAASAKCAGPTRFADASRSNQAPVAGRSLVGLVRESRGPLVRSGSSAPFAGELNRIDPKSNRLTSTIKLVLSCSGALGDFPRTVVLSGSESSAVDASAPLQRLCGWAPSRLPFARA